MNTKKQKIILIISIIVIITCTIISIKTILNSNSSSNSIDNYGINNKEILKNIKVDDLLVTNTNITINEDVSNYSAIITNESAKDYYIKSLYIVYTVNETEHKLPLLMDTTLSPAEKQIVYATLDTDVKEITKLEYAIEK